jgi:twitching motility protein PilI
MIQEYFAIQLTDRLNLALPLIDIESVSRFEQHTICPIPGVAKFWLGVINHRGSLLWVLDMQKFLHINASQERPSQQLTTVVLTHQLQGSRRRVALVVDKLQGVIACEPSQFQPLPSSLPSQLQHSCQATVTQTDQTFCIINPENFLNQLHEQSMVTSY